jgi:Flp pilus assembly protein TadB
VEFESERMEREQLRHLSTADLIKHALTEAQLLAKAEILHAKKELKEEAKAAKTSGILLGAAAVFALSAVAALFVALGLALPVGPALGVLLVGLFLLVLTGTLAFVGVKKLPRKPLPHTQARLRTDLTLTRETLQ